MKKLIVLAVAALGFTFNVSAQNKATSNTKEMVAQKANPQSAIEKSADDATQKLEKLVGSLSTEQKAQIKEANLNAERRKQIVMQMNDANKDNMLKEIESNRTRMYLEVLKDNQAKKYQQSLSK